MAAAARRFASLLAEAEQDEPPKAAASFSSEQTEQSAPAGKKDEPENAAGKNEKETRRKMKKRHENELVEMEEQCRQKLSEAKKKNKLIREAVQVECAEMKRSCILRQEKELASAPSDDGEPELDDSLAAVDLNAQDEKGSGTAFGYRSIDASKKKGKQQKRKEAKAAEEEKRYQEAKDSMKDWVDPKEVENRQLQAKLAPLKLKVHPIPSDGHCMYRAISDQCKLHIDAADLNLADLIAKDSLTYQHLRERAASFMQSHPDDFAPFIIDEDIEGAQADGGDILSAYLKRLTGTAEWGGNLELIALARALPAHIHVHSAGADEHVFAPDVPSNLHLYLSFHRHAFGLGEHYNSLHPAA